MPTPAPSHIPVLLAPIREAARGAHRVVDATLGHGGHAEMFLGLGAEVLGIDRDPEALAIARARLGDRLRTFEGPYASDEALAAVAAFRPDFILLDLGVSSRQLDDDARGFTFRPGASLDMRMGREGPTGADLLNTASEGTLADIFHQWGDERKARPLAREVVRRRGNAPFATSDDLVNAIRSVLGPRSGPGDFARLFQALRIAVNDELAGLERALPAFLEALVPGGQLAVIGYHSGEDRVAKHLFQEWARSCVCPPEQPMCTCRGTPLGTLVPRKPIVADDAEVASNPRARSARLRIFRKAA
ncbi:MAG TPA: 16S rRNA (cytosine(1402)-N(4))-methyltransferase RsmH [Gemmatimonadales bacterium]|nr:16S rRNA (cytosine(1402)-N(4))-methyltransferase RsmH [Gemmatimonadales bacterium]